jgi:protocatechuate 3,4-dioxygenase beta subunit
MKSFTHWKEVLTRLKDGLMPNQSTTGWKTGRTVAYWSVATALLLLFGFGNFSQDQQSANSPSFSFSELFSSKEDKMNMEMMNLLLNVNLNVSTGSAGSGEVFRYDIAYSTISPTLAADEPVIYLPFPNGMELFSFQGTADVVSTQVVTYMGGPALEITMIDPLPAGSAGLMSAEVFVPAGTVCDGTVITTAATFESSNAQNSPVSSGTQVTTITATTPWNISIQEVSIAPPGFNSVYRVAILPTSPTGYQALDNVELAVALPAGTSFVSCAGGCTTNAAMDSLFWSPGLVMGPTSFNYTINVPNTFVPGDALEQNVSFSSDYAYGCPGDPPNGDQDQTTIIPVPINEISCTNPSLSTYEIGLSGSYCAFFGNTGDFFEDNVTATFTLPAALQLDAINPVAYTVAGVNVDVLYTTNSNSTPTLLGSYTSDVVPTGGFAPPSLPAGEWVNAIIYDLGTQVPPGFAVDGFACLDYTIIDPDQDGNPVVGANPRINGLTCSGGNNTEGYTCLTTSVTVSADGLPDSFCSTDRVARRPPEGPTNLNKTVSGGTSVDHGDTLLYTLRFQNCGGTGSFSNINISDVLPPSLEFASGFPVTYSNNLPAPDNFNYDPGSRTLSWDWSSLPGPPIGTRCGATFEIYYYAYIPLGTAPSALTNCFEIDWDGSDLSGEPGGAGTPLPSDCLTVNVAPSVEVNSRKGVKGDCDLDYIFFDPSLPPGDVPSGNYNGIARTFAGGEANYILEIVNTGNIVLDSFTLIDILPWIGDEAVSAPFARESEWRPNKFMDVKLPPSTDIYYSIEPNPCREEFVPAYNPPGCTGPQWQTVKPADDTEIQAIKVFFDFDFQPLDTLRVSWDMRAPFGTPIDIIAWNSFAYQGRRMDNGQRFIVAEPNKVGIVVKPFDPGTVAVGNYVWVDQNMDGIQNEDPEDGLNDIGVYLFDVGPDGLKNTVDDIAVDTTITGNDFNGDPGYYLFSNLPPSEYYVVFELDSLPSNTTPTLQDQGGDDTLDSDADPVMGMTGTTGPMVAGDLDETLDMGVNPTGCELFPIIRVICNNGNDCNAGDDTYTYEITVNREINGVLNNDGTYNLRADNDFYGPDFDIVVGIPYGSTQTFGPYPVSEITGQGNDIFLTLRDGVDQSCVALETVSAPAPLNFVGGSNGISTTDCYDSGSDLLYDLTVNYEVGDDGAGVLPANALVEITLTESGNTQTVTYPVAMGTNTHTFTGLTCDGDNDIDVVLRYVEDAPGNAPIADVCGSTCEIDEPCYVDVEDVNVIDNCRSTGTYQIEVIGTIYNFSGTITVSDFTPATVNVSGVEGVSQTIATITEDCDGIIHTVTVTGSPTTNSTCSSSDTFEGPRDRDYGDLVDAFGTTNAQNGPYHLIFDDIFLGVCVDSELNGAPDPDAGTGATGGDDNTPGGDVTCTDDDEDGIILPMLVAGVTTNLDFDLENTSGLDAKLVIYLDWNNNQDLTDAGEMFSVIVPSGSTTAQIPVTPPVTTVLNRNLGVRVRFSTHQSGTMSPTGVAFDGEVEDYLVMVMGFDYGDLPDSGPGTGAGNYETLLANGGPQHKILTDANDNPTLGFGAQVDPEADGTPDIDAEGDDDAYLADEDGLPVPFLEAGSTTNLVFSTFNNTGVDAKLTVFADWNNNGVLDDAGEMFSATVADGTTSVTIPVSVPISAVLNTDIGLRTRLSTDFAASMSPTGVAPDGEIEDYLTQVVAYDYGDLPESYNTSDPNGPRHVIVNELLIGDCVDSEIDGQPDPMAGMMSGGDDNAGGQILGGTCGTPGDDEDGIVWVSPMVPGSSACFEASAINNTGALAYLQGWIDFNGNGTFEANEELSGGDFSPNGVEVPTGGAFSATVCFDVPATAVFTNGEEAFARFRISNEGNLDPSTQALMDPIGEVEDYKFQLAQIGNYTWLDDDFDGVQDNNESPVNDIPVTLTWAGPDGIIGNGDDETYSTVTGPNGGEVDGEYYFIGLIEGTYKVTFAEPAGFELTQANSPNANDGTDSDADPNMGGMTGEYTLAPGDQDFTVDAGYFALSSMGNFVWEDLDGDGIQDVGEPGVPNVPVTLTGTDGLGNPVNLSTTTDGNGEYLFDDLLPGEYKVTFGLPGGYEFSEPNQGADDAVDSDADPDMNGMTVFEVLTSGENNLTYDAGIYQPAQLGNYTWVDDNLNGQQDANEDPLPGVIVVLNGTTGAGEPVTASAVTDANGLYLFTDLAPGSYKVTFESPNGTYMQTQVDQGNDATDSDADPAMGGMTGFYTLESGESDLTVDAGYYEAASIGNFVWEDLNGDGTQDPGEPGVQGVEVTLTGTDAFGNSVTLTTNTDVDGEYLFDGLVPGDYKLTFGAVAGYELTPVDEGGNDALDSDADPAMGGMTVVETLTSGENNLTYDAGLYQPAELGNYTWIDANANGIQDPNESPISGVVATLTGTTGTGVNVTETATTDANGLYLFTDLAPGTYKVTFATPAGYESTAANAGTDDAVDSDADPNMSGMTGNYTLESGDSDLTVDAGYYELASIGNFVWEDLDGDGVQDAGEPGVPNVPVTLTGTDGQGNDVTLTTTTDGNGEYLFDDLVPGEYKLTFGAVAGYEFTASNIGGDDALDSDANPAMNGMTVFEVLTSGENNLTYDAGLYQPAQLGNYTWIDDNVDGQQDANESPLPGVTAILNGTTGAGEPVTASAITDANGLYLFDNLAPGTYKVTFESPNGTYAQTQVDQGNDATDSDADPAMGGMTGNYTLASGDSDLTVDAGYYEAASIGNFVWEDLNGDGTQDPGEPGVQGVEVTLTGTDAFGNSVTLTTNTDVDGEYLFDGLVPGDYKLTFGAVAGYELTPVDEGGNDALDSDADPAMGGMTVVETLTSGENNLTYDAGLVQPAELGNYTWIDANANGIQDPNESPISGVVATLTGTTGTGVNVTETATTDANGLYLFTDLAPGTYKVTFATPAGYETTAVDAGTDDAVDSDADPNMSGMTGNYTLESGDSDLTVDAGYYELASIGNFVWEDLDGDGVQDAGEPGVPNVPVTLTGTDGQGNDVTLTTTTDGNGEYLFDDLVPGEYKLTFGAVAGYEFTASNIGGDDALDSDANPAMNGMTVFEVLTSGENNLTYDAGIYQPAQLGNYTWIDDNLNGQQDANEQPLAGVTVILDGTTGAGVAVNETAITDANGLYLFDNLAPGTYKVTFESPNGTYAQTQVNIGNDATDSDADPAMGGMTGNYTLASGDSDLTVDAGYYELASIGNFVWSDLDADGIQDTGEPGIVNAEVILSGTDAFGNTVALSTFTDGNGEYLFDNLVPGDYKLTFVTPTGFDFTSPLDAGGDAVDSDADPNMGGMTVTETLTSGENNLTYDAGFYGCPEITIFDIPTMAICPGEKVGAFEVNTIPGATTISWSGGASIGLADGSGAGPNLEIPQFTATAEGTVTITVTATLGQCTITETFQITIDDSGDPGFVNCPMNMVVNNDVDKCGANVIWSEPVAIDDCETELTVTQTAGPAPGSFLPIGVTTITYEADDLNGNTMICSFTIEVMDMQMPTAICQDITISLDENGNASIVAGDVDAGSYDNCPVANLSIDVANFDCEDLGDNNVTLTVTDGVGMTESCVATVTIVDDIDPTIECPDDITVSNDAGVCGAVVEYEEPIIDDNCPLETGAGAPEELVVNGDFETGDLGPWSTLGLGNTGICGSTNRDYLVGSTGTVTGCIDPGDPISGSFALYNMLDGAGALNYRANQLVTVPTGVDQADLSWISTWETSFSGDPRFFRIQLYDVTGTTLLATLWEQSFFGSESSGGWINNMEDVTTVLQGLEGQTVMLDLNIEIPQSWTGPAGFGIDDVSLQVTSSAPSLVQVEGLPSGSVFPVGTTTNTFVVTDAAGNTATCSFDVTVTDDEDPILACPANATITTSNLNSAGDCAGLYEWMHPEPTDNCGLDAYDVTYTNPDGTIDGPDNLLQVAANYIDEMASRNFGVGTTTVSYYVVDVNGNDVSCSFTVTVTDDEDPTFVNCPSDLTVKQRSGSECGANVSGVTGSGRQLWRTKCNADSRARLLATSCR